MSIKVNFEPQIRVDVSDFVSAVNGMNIPFPQQKVFLTSYDEAYQFFANCFNTDMFKSYVVDEEEMRIEMVTCLAEAEEFFREEPLTSDHMLDSLRCLMGALEAGSYSYPPGLAQGAKLEIEPLDAVLKLSSFDDTHIILHKGNVCDHDRKTYVGFTEKYDYCEKCGEKNI